MPQAVEIAVQDWDECGGFIGRLFSAEKFDELAKSRKTPFSVISAPKLVRDKF